MLNDINRRNIHTHLFNLKPNPVFIILSAFAVITISVVIANVFLILVFLLVSYVTLFSKKGIIVDFSEGKYKKFRLIFGISFGKFKKLPKDFNIRKRRALIYHSERGRAEQLIQRRHVLYLVELVDVKGGVLVLYSDTDKNKRDNAFREIQEKHSYI